MKLFDHGVCFLAGEASRKVLWTAVAERSSDTAFEPARRLITLNPTRVWESGVAFHFPPQSKTASRLPARFEGFLILTRL